MAWSQATAPYVLFPPRFVCPECGGEAKEPYAFSGRGEIFSYTVMNDAPTGFQDTTPYTVALVKLEEGPVVTAQLTDLGEEPVKIGMPVERVTRRIRQDGYCRDGFLYLQICRS